MNPSTICRSLLTSTCYRRLEGTWLTGDTGNIMRSPRKAGGLTVAIAARPLKGSRCLAVVFPAILFAHVHVHVGDCHQDCSVRIRGSAHHLTSAHLPRGNREDSTEVATEFMHAAFQVLHGLRYFDTMSIGVDLNLDLQRNVMVAVGQSR